MLAQLVEKNLLHSFHTTLADGVGLTGKLLHRLSPRQAARRRFAVDPKLIHLSPWRELLRLTPQPSAFRWLTAHETGLASVFQVYQALDRSVARFVLKSSGIDAVYAYEDGALATFQAAKSRGRICYYDLPIAYYALGRRICEEESERLPQWAPTMSGLQDSPEKLARKDEELKLADRIVVPSLFVQRSLPEWVDPDKVVFAPFGSPVVSPQREKDSEAADGPLRVLFLGSMTQRKGLADVFAAIKQFSPRQVRLTVCGSPGAPMEFYRQKFADFHYEKTRPHGEILRLMQAHDLFILPSLVEGRALVQQEALACGLPLIVTANAGGEDLIEEGKTGFLVPIRDPEAIREKIEWFLLHKSRLHEMRLFCQQKAAALTWNRYAETIIASFS